MAVLAVASAGCNLGSPAVVHPAPARAVETVDLDGDGALDVVSAGRDGYAVLTNDGTGRLERAVVSTGLDVRAFALGDVDGDGNIDRVDLHRPDQATSTLYLSEGDGRGGFTTPRPITEAAWELRDVDLGDLDGDGDLDIAAASAPLTTWRNDGAAGFSGPFQWGRDLAAHDAVIADFDRDGDEDVVSASLQSLGPPQHPTEFTTAVVSVAYNEAGRFESSVTHGLPIDSGRPAQGFLTGGLAVADVDEDGRLDIVTAARREPVVLVTPGDESGEPSFDTRVIPAPDASTGVELTDIDGDGHLDVVALALAKAAANILYGDGTGGFSEPHGVATGGQSVNGVASGRIDGDASVDLVFANDGDFGNSSVGVLLNTLGRRQH